MIINYKYSEDKILKELIRLGKADSVRLQYNTNFTRMAYKDLNVLDIWPEFADVSVGASLDAMGPRAELMRNGTIWADVERNRAEMLKKCPKVDFFISPTVSIFNVDHIPDFHWDWLQKGLIKGQDLNVNVLQDPMHYRVDILPTHMKSKVEEKLEKHIERIDSPKYNMSIGVVKFSENLRTFSKNLTINTIIITLIILFLS